MMKRDSTVTGILFTLLVLATGAGVWWLIKGKSSEPTKSSAPSVPAEWLKEDQLTVLKPNAEAIAKLQFGVIDRQAMPRTRLFGGEVTVPPGKTIIVSAPFNGLLKTISSEAPIAGMAVEKGKAVFELLPLLTPEGRATLAASLVEAQGQVNNAESQKKAAEIARDRAKALFRDDAGSKRQLDDAEAAYDLAKSMHTAAVDRQKKLKELAGEAENGTAAPLPILAPANGILRNVTVAQDQSVPAGAVLFEVLDFSTVWIRVPIHVGEEDDLKPDASALVGRLTARTEKIGLPSQTKEKLFESKRVAAPPSANAAAGSVDVWFELANATPKFKPNQRVGVTLTFNTESESLTAPWSAVVHDIYGGTWVYESLGDGKFARRRVIVRYVANGLAALAVGPPKGTKVVTVGADLLFGAETGFSK